jgi:homoserine kinase
VNGALRASVRVPATTSNLGAGFDCVGLAIDRWLRASVAVAQVGGITVQRRGTLEAVQVQAPQDLLVVGFVTACGRVGRDVPAHFSILAQSEIPVARGLGSSAAALVAGAVLASEALSLRLTRDDIVEIGAEVEGHADNVAAAVHGGAVLSVLTRGKSYRTTPLPVSDSLAFVFASPDFETETKRARAALPSEIAFSKAVTAAGKAAALVRGLQTGDSGLLTVGLDDVLHVPYRKALIRGYNEVTGAAIGAGAFGATLSGSGSTLVAIAPRARAQQVASAMQNAWEKLGVRSSIFVNQKSVGGYDVITTSTPTADPVVTTAPSARTGV